MIDRARKAHQRAIFGDFGGWRWAAWFGLGLVLGPIYWVLSSLRPGRRADVDSARAVALWELEADRRAAGETIKHKWGRSWLPGRARR